MIYLKHKNEEFAAFKTYKVWAKRQLGTTLKCKQTDHGGEFMPNEQKAEQNRTPNVHAKHSTTKWTSRKVPANHHKWS